MAGDNTIGSFISITVYFY